MATNSSSQRHKLLTATDSVFKKTCDSLIIVPYSSDSKKVFSMLFVDIIIFRADIINV